MNKKQKHDVKLTINNEVIKQVKSTTFLGIIAEECLTWNEHIDSVAKKIIKSAGIISKIRRYTNLKYSETCLLCFSLSISIIWKYNLE